MNHKKLQIGVMGSMADTSLNVKQEKLAKQLGKEIALAGALLLFGFEGDHNSLSTIACKEAEKNGGKTVAFLWGEKGSVITSLNSIRIETGQQRGGGREFPLVRSCDAIVCIGGGSGTLTEIAIAYQANVPIFVIAGTGGWSDTLANTFLDNRNRIRIKGVKTAKDAVNRIKKLCSSKTV